MNSSCWHALVLGLAGCLLPAQAQWMEQAIALKRGWSAIFLHVDASHESLEAAMNELDASSIAEIWRWNPSSPASSVGSPAEPAVSQEWQVWRREDPQNRSLQRLVGDSAYLVRLNDDAAPASWRVTGRPVLPRNEWTLSGLNLIGFPVHDQTPPNLQAFLDGGRELLPTPPEIFHYPGGPLGAANPVAVPSNLRPEIQTRRGEAYWIRSGTVFNRYFGPFELVVSNDDPFEFGERSESATFRLRNLTAAELTVRVTLRNSVPDPTGKVAILGVPPLLIRASAVTLPDRRFAVAAELKADGFHEWRLSARGQPGSEVEVVLAPDRVAMAMVAAPGARFGGILEFADSLGYTQIQAPLAATVASRAGLWVGTATLDMVRHDLVSYTREERRVYGEAENGELILLETLPDQIVTDAMGRYQATETNRMFAPVPKPFTGRLIVHDSGTNALLLQRVYHGFDLATNVVLARKESALAPATLGSARRISSTFVPWTLDNSGYAFDRSLENVGSDPLTATVDCPFNDHASNPFLHTYHPDHDALDDLEGKPLGEGNESYGIQRLIRLKPAPPADDFASRIAIGNTLEGGYEETITLRGINNSTKEYEVRGVFSMTRVSTIEALQSE